MPVTGASVNRHQGGPLDLDTPSFRGTRLDTANGLISFRVSVGNLLQTVSRSGDINFRFTSRSSAMEGIRGHQKLQRSRPGGYQAEVAIRGKYQWQNLVLEVSGRIDGVYADSDPVIIDEIKTLKMPVADLPPSQQALHWGQAKIYGWLYALEKDLDQITVQLSYYHLDTNEVTEFQEHYSATELQEFFEDLAARYLRWLDKIQAWRVIRDASINELTFPYGNFRPGQREFAVNSYRSMVSGQQLFVQAPTGVGKTVGTLFPAVKAMGEGHHQKVFFLTAKTVGRSIAEATLADMSSAGMQLKSVTLTAKDKICFNPGSPCDPEHCEFAVGYFDKLDGVLDNVLSRQNTFRRQEIERIAREHEMCPFELSLDLSYWVDCIICDYNYVFDPTVYLRRFFDDPVEAYCFLIDEAHNLVDRGRDMFSAEIEKNGAMKLKRKLKKAEESGTADVMRKLEGINRAFLKLRKAHIESLDEHEWAVSDELPTDLLLTLRSFCDRAEIWLAEHDRRANSYEELLEFYFDALRLNRTAEYFDDNYVCLIKRLKKNSLLVRLYCVDPSRLLAKGLERGRSSLFFSATLSPIDYYRNLLGADAASRFVALSSPFPVANLGVFVIRDIATNYRQRNSSYDRIVAVIDTVSGSHSGNYLVYFPSYHYMEQVHQRFAAEHADIATIIQSRGMAEEDRQAFLDRFDADNTDLLVGFAVMGGIFGEGIDLKGKRLVGVVIVGVGLPQLGIERDLVRDHFSTSGEAQGFEYAYQYPGMNRVLQTAGRVIRSEQDQGIICLIDDRFAQQRYSRLFPPHWVPRVIRQAALGSEISDFWVRLTPG